MNTSDEKEAEIMSAAKEIAKQIISGALSPLDGSWKIYQLIWEPPDRLDELTRFIGFWSCLDDSLRDKSPYAAQSVTYYEEKIREEARRLLREEPPAEK